MKTLAGSRYSLAWKLYLTAVTYFAATRLYLLADTLIHGRDDLGLQDLATIFSVGFFYDTVFYLYALLPVSLYLWLMPRSAWNSRFNAALVHLLVFGTLYGLGFIAVSEVLFWNEFDVRFNFISVDYLVYRREVTDNITESYPIPLLLTLIFLASAAVYATLRKQVTAALHTQEPWGRRSAFAAANLLLALLAIQFVGQGLRDGSKPYVRELSSNGPYQFIAAFRNNELDYNTFYPTEEDSLASDILKKEVVGTSTTSLQPQQEYSIKRRVVNEGPPEKYNIILVMVESLSANYLGVNGNSKGLTPTLDKLTGESLYFNRMYATGTRTTRGLEAVTLSIPPTPGRSIVKRIGKESNLFSLGNVLGDAGYDVRFIYGGRGYFDNMNAFFSGNGYAIIDQTSTPDAEIGFENAWGMADEYLYTQAMKAADESYANKKPFFFHVMTTSNHRPYTYPEGRIDIPSGTGRDGAVKYTDWAIGDFLSRARHHEWFDNTLFVFIADHTAGSAGKTDLPVRKYHIPMMVYAPKLLKPRTVDKVASQIDVAPTLLGLLNLSYASEFFGRDILNTPGEQGRALIGNYQHLGYYTPGRLSILSPQRVEHQLVDPENENAHETVQPDTQHLKQAIAYYQGAYNIYTRGLNRWEATPDLHASNRYTQQHLSSFR